MKRKIIIAIAICISVFLGTASAFGAALQPPANFKVTAPASYVPSGMQINATWSAVQGATSYRVSVVSPDGSFGPYRVIGTSAQIKCTNAGKYTVELYTVKGSEKSKSVYKTVEIAPAAQTITISAKTLTAAPGKSISLGAKASSGGGLTYSSSAPSVISVSASGVLSYKKVGTAKITIKQAGSRNYKAASKTVTATCTKTSAQTKKSQKITSIDAYSFSDAGKTLDLNAKASGGKVTYSSSNKAVATVTAAGKVTAKKSGSATITIKQAGNKTYKAASKSVKISVPAYRSRKDALAPWKHTMIDTFFHINGRRYSLSRPGKWWGTASTWNGKTGDSGDTQSCITLPTVSAKRAGLISHDSGNIWLTSNMASTPNSTVKALKARSKKVTVTYPHRSLKSLIATGDIKYGDIVCRSGHTFVYMGSAYGKQRIFTSGHQRGIGNDTCIYWGNGQALTTSIQSAIRRSDAQGSRWYSKKISDDAFYGEPATGDNYNNAIHIVCSINTFKVKTTCINGSITKSNLYQAGRDVTISYSPCKGRTLDYIKVDGNKIKTSTHKSSVTLKDLSENRTVIVKYK